MSESKTPSIRTVLYAALAAAVLVAVLQQSGGISGIRTTLEGWGLSRFTVNVLYGVALGLLLGLVLRAVPLLSRGTPRGESEATNRRPLTRRIRSSDDEKDS